MLLFRGWGCTQNSSLGMQGFVLGHVVNKYRDDQPDPKHEHSRSFMAEAVQGSNQGLLRDGGTEDCQKGLLVCREFGLIWSLEFQELEIL